MNETNPPDFLDEIIEERTKANPNFPAMLQAAIDARNVVKALVSRRVALGMTQETIALRMGTSQPAIARLESGKEDPRISTVWRYAAALETKVATPLAQEHKLYS